MSEICSSWTKIYQDDIIDMNNWDPNLHFRDKNPQNRGYKREGNYEYLFKDNRDLLLKEIQFLNSLNSNLKLHIHEF